MTHPQFITVQIDLAKIRLNMADIRQRTGMPVLAVVKADAYGLGITRIAPAIANLVDAFCVFNLTEAKQARLWEITGKPILAIGPSEDVSAQEYLAVHVRPAVTTIGHARHLRDAHPILCVDTGMQRFACPEDQIEPVLAAGGCDEAFTHAIHPRQAIQLHRLLGNRGLKLHAAATSLLDEPSARLDAVRPGLALYRGAVRISARVVEVHQSTGPAGYTGFISPRHGVIMAGYSHGLRPGPCLINGTKQKVLEVGMQTAFISLGPTDRPGDEVILLGDGLTEETIAADWKTSPQQTLVCLARLAERQYVDG